ncbi:hypothetical protein P171DRAFT_474044 [Karstenula rhodostoma CBS 690.94]|uniref:Uncharacterized protein n=1 Tax=Karstenula rhodostoma CBS 690.94 TaxID=1392251 RepID=A0A9P4UC30_9PLEO|nr:hypothetical protein P171DRAFT_474044 [Karstenula rhodostoma CBS 690.94]
MPSLMTLPPEIRDQICTHAILTPNTPTSISQSSEALLPSRVELNTPHIRAWSHVVLYERKPPNTTTDSLLQLSKQLRTETQATLAHLAASPPSYTLDLIILNETELLPTWTSVPVATTRVDTVDVALRISGVHEVKGWRSYEGFTSGNGLGPAMGWQLYAVLERFLRVGVRGETGDEDTHMHVAANCIRIDVQTPPGVAAAQFGPPLTSLSPLRNKNGGTVLDPGYLVAYVEENLEGLLAGGNYKWFTCGQILFEHVGEIVVCKDGVEVRRWDIAEQLRELGDIPEQYFSAEQLRGYKKKAWQARRERGLKFLESV